MNNENSQAMFYNVGELEGLSTDLTAKAASFKGLIDEMYALISELDTGGMWKGELNDTIGLFPYNFVEEVSTGTVCSILTPASFLLL